MIPSPNSLSKVMAGLRTICVTFGERREHRHQVLYPLTYDRLDVLVEPRDEIAKADLSFCRCLNVWIDAKQADYRRARILWQMLLKPENLPAMIFTNTADKLCAFDTVNTKKVLFPCRLSNL